MVDAIGNIVSITIVLILIITLILPKKIRYVIHALFLLLFGLIPILFRLGLLGVTFEDTPQLAYAVLFIIVIVGRTLMVEGVRLESHIKYFVITLGVVIIILTTIPVLHTLGALSFRIPKYPTIINELLYILSAVFMIMLTFMIEKE